MRKFALYYIGVALAVTTLASPAALTAQDEMPAKPASLTPEQQAVYDAWPPDQKLAFDMWPAEIKEYFWSLPEQRQKLFWRLTDDDKLALTRMSQPERDAAWQEIEARAAVLEPPEDG